MGISPVPITNNPAYSDKPTGLCLGWTACMLTGDLIYMYDGRNQQPRLPYSTAENRKARSTEAS